MNWPQSTLYFPSTIPLHGYSLQLSSLTPTSTSTPLKNPTSNCKVCESYLSPFPLCQCERMINAYSCCLDVGQFWNSSVIHSQTVSCFVSFLQIFDTVSHIGVSPFYHKWQFQFFAGSECCLHTALFICVTSSFHNLDLMSLLDGHILWLIVTE